MHINVALISFNLEMSLGAVAVYVPTSEPRKGPWAEVRFSAEGANPHFHLLTQGDWED